MPDVPFKRVPGPWKQTAQYPESFKIAKIVVAELYCAWMSYSSFVDLCACRENMLELKKNREQRFVFAVSHISHATSRRVYDEWYLKKPLIKQTTSFTDAILNENAYSNTENQQNFHVSNKNHTNA